MCKKISFYFNLILLIAALVACTVSPTPATSATTAVQADVVPTSTAISDSETQPTATTVSAALTYPIVDTGQTVCYDANGTQAACPAQGSAFYGQDAQYTGNAPSYTDNGDGTITDNVTGLTWQQSPDTNGDGTIDAADKLTYEEALVWADTLVLAGYTDWRLPTIKELYSLILFDGIDPSGPGRSAVALIPFIDIDYFGFAYGDAAAGERTIDAQFASSTKYVATTMGGAETMFGVNFADGRIKGYGLSLHGQAKTFFVLCVRGNPAYGQNELVDNGDGTLTDRATGLIWAQDDSGAGLDWQEALAWLAQKNAENYLGYNDWRLPNAKELQSIVDYSRSPDATNSAAIDPLFDVTTITNEAGQIDYPWYWSSTTHANLQNGMNAAYVAFGRAMGYMNNAWVDVHGAGAQRSDPKSGDVADYPTGHGPQGDAIRIENFVRLVRGGDVTATPDGSAGKTRTGITVDISGIEQQPGSDQFPPPPNQPGGEGHRPPREAVDACAGQSEGVACSFDDQNGTHTGTCALVQQQLTCMPGGVSSDGNDAPGQKFGGEQKPPHQDRDVGQAGATYNIEQAISDKAQGMTIAFDALAFLTGDRGADSFFPPGKVADFWGFQYLRDNDPSQMGHAGDFLTSAALNVLSILTPAQRADLVALAEGQVDAINEYGYRRFVLIDAFRRLLEGNLPAGATGLDEAAVKAYSAELYRLDGEISYERAQVMGGLLNALDATQLAYLNDMVGKGMLEWPDVEEPSDIRGLDRDVKVAVMTYAADMFSWYAGSVEADIYFCPERHGTYFGSFYLKDIPAMGHPEYAIPTNMTGEMGEAMLNMLTPEQAQLITGLVEVQRPYLLGIVDVRKQISSHLRKFMAGESADSAAVSSLMQAYGELDGAIIYNLAINFGQVAQTLTGEQRAQLMALRVRMLGEELLYPSGAFLYSQPIDMPAIPSTDFLFAAP